MFAEKLRTLERRFAQNMVSLPRVQSPLDAGKHPPNNRGADKMHPRGMDYSRAYEALLGNREPRRLVELGVFTGVSMALWCDVYPDAEVIGLDIDLERVDWVKLEQRGAWRLNKPTLFEWDAFDPKPLELLNDVDVFIDDGPHVTDAVVKVAEFMRPRMAPGGLYIVEDMANGAELLREVFPEGNLRKFGMLNAVEL